jgi:7,8-dihydropterin-6-yl-methyl-4-(beta-D-ribofuranosyl)aminobenzene 5'-phosphate synthase
VFNPLPDGLGSSSRESTEPVRLRAVDSVEITIVVDNSIDYLLRGDKRASRASLSPGWTKKPQLRAEHGYSLLFTFQNNGASRTFLYDAGLTPETLIHNLGALGVSLTDLEAIVLSHGHVDHHGGLLGLVQKIGKRRLPLVLHPDAWRNRKVFLPFGIQFELPPPDRKALEKEDVQIIEEQGPSLLIGDEALVTGRVERVTDFEKGVQFQYAEQDGKWTEDPWIWDDQAIIFNLKGKGLVVASSCSHAGAVNILRSARKTTGVDKIHAFVGGLHLPVGFAENIPQTMQELETIRPDVIVPGHCTGWKATHEIERRMPNAFVSSSVGTQLHFR